jgi:hypothetical protein
LQPRAYSEGANKAKAKQGLTLLSLYFVLSFSVCVCVGKAAAVLSSFALPAFEKGKASVVCRAASFGWLAATYKLAFEPARRSSIESQAAAAFLPHKSLQMLA